MFEYSCQIIGITDGDTIKVDIDLGFNIHIKEKVRLARIDCPETNTVGGKQSKEFLQQFLGKTVTINTRKTDKYGRYIGEITIYGEGNENKNLSDIIVENGFGKYVTY